MNDAIGLTATHAADVDYSIGEIIQFMEVEMSKQDEVNYKFKNQNEKLSNEVKCLKQNVHSRPDIRCKYLLFLSYSQIKRFFYLKLLK